MKNIIDIRKATRSRQKQNRELIYTQKVTFRCTAVERAQLEKLAFRHAKKIDGRDQGMSAYIRHRLKLD